MEFGLEEDTHNRLKGMGWHMANKCVLCNGEEETDGHLFMGCPSTLAVWKNVSGERDEVIQLLQDQQDAMVVLKQWPKLQVPGLGSYIWTLLPYVVLWSVWSMRTDVIFQEEGFSVEAATMRVKATLWAWLAMLPESLKERSKHNFINLARNWQAVLEPG
ncbi:hypothetical protein FRX31_020183 [Thalictrum thalictroides]|uniref:Reverse transcriptase zinc-binding domain-containing protein n=1 Tax=Thalictrum thalictroides TaxID=46969 RepID=A0A7J6W152_THATH|nr:hypothetical protein FRX31_020183 [Thalictrum thalictroides]